MDPLVGSAAIGAGANIFGNLMNQGLTRRQNRRMVEFWKMQNEYNHPSQQMARLREAGLNPNMIYGDSVKGAAGNADQLKPEKPIPYDFGGVGSAISDYHSFKRMDAQVDLLRSQNTTELANAVFKAAQAAGEGLRNVTEGAKAKYAEELAKSSLQAQQMVVNNMQQDWIKKRLDNQRISETNKSLIAQEIVKLANLEKTGKNIDLSNELRKLETELKRAGLENAPYWIRWIKRELDDLDGSWLQFLGPVQGYKGEFYRRNLNRN